MFKKKKEKVDQIQALIIKQIQPGHGWNITSHLRLPLSCLPCHDGLYPRTVRNSSHSCVHQDVVQQQQGKKGGDSGKGVTATGTVAMLVHGQHHKL